MTALADIREALAANLDGLTDMQVSAYMLANPTPPAIEIVPDEVAYDLAMGRGLDQWRLTVRAFVGLTTDQGAQRRLDLMLDSAGPQSIKELIEADCKLGGAANDLRVVRASGYRIFAREGQPVIGAEWQVDVYAAG